MSEEVLTRWVLAILTLISLALVIWCRNLSGTRDNHETRLNEIERKMHGVEKDLLDVKAETGVGK
jgi:hypothetical protein